MKNHQSSNSKLLPLFGLAGIILPVLSGGFLAIDYIGYPNAPTPIVPYILLPVGLLSGAVGQRLTAGRWQGVPEYLHMTLAFVGLAYIGLAVKYAVVGRSIHRYPAGLFLVISSILMISRLLAKHHVRLRAAIHKCR
jgi:hypothetical protein